LEEIENITDCLVVTGTNVFETQPVTSYRIRKAVERGAKLVVIDPRFTKMAEIACINLKPRIGTDVLVFNALAKIILEEGLYDREFIERRVEGFDEFCAWMQNFSLKEAARVTGLPADRLREVARIYAASRAGMILWSMGITQHTTGTDNVMALSNLALLTGQIGKPGAGLSPLRGQNNVQGACDMGALAEFYPGYQRPEKEETRARFRELWQVQELPAQAGLTVVEIFESAYQGKIKGL
jgi:predicted molibdopterin-dependent oxidoreductase YjgC